MQTPITHARTDNFDDFMQIFDQVTPNSLVLFDIDDVCLFTRIIEKKLEGREQPEDYISPDPTIKQITVGNKIFFYEFSRPMYPGLKRFVDSCQQIGAKVIGLTATALSKNNFMSQYLPKLGIRFTNENFSNYAIEGEALYGSSDSDYGFIDGTIYCGNRRAIMEYRTENEVVTFSRKGTNLVRFFDANSDKLANIDKIIFFDDNSGNLDDVELVCKKFFKCDSLMVGLPEEKTVKYELDLAIKDLSFDQTEVENEEAYYKSKRFVTILFTRLGFSFKDPNTNEIKNLISHAIGDFFGVNDDILSILKDLFVLKVQKKDQTDVNTFIKDDLEELFLLSKMSKSDIDIVFSVLFNSNDFFNKIIAFLVDDPSIIPEDTQFFWDFINTKLDSSETLSNFDPSKSVPFSYRDFSLSKVLICNQFVRTEPFIRDYFTEIVTNNVEPTSDEEYLELLIDLRTYILDTFYAIPFKLLVFVLNNFSDPFPSTLDFEKGISSISFEDYINTFIKLFSESLKISDFNIPFESNKLPLQEKIELIKTVKIFSPKMNYQQMLTRLKL